MLLKSSRKIMEVKMTNPGSKQIKIRYAVYSRLMKQKGNSLSEKVENLLNDYDANLNEHSFVEIPTDKNVLDSQMDKLHDALWKRFAPKLQNMIDNSIEDAKRSR